MMFGLTLKELEQLIKRINKHHFLKGRGIKYCYLSLDFRTNIVFTITFKSYGGDEKKFTVVNRMVYDETNKEYIEEPGLPDKIETEILNWLKEAEHDAIRTKQKNW